MEEVLFYGALATFVVAVSAYAFHSPRFAGPVSRREAVVGFLVLMAFASAALWRTERNAGGADDAIRQTAASADTAIVEAALKVDRKQRRANVDNCHRQNDVRVGLQNFFRRQIQDRLTTDLSALFPGTDPVALDAAIAAAVARDRETRRTFHPVPCQRKYPRPVIETPNQP